MLRTLGLSGLLGALVLVAGVGLVAVRDPLIATGLVLMLVGLGLLVRSAVQGMLSAFGMSGMV